MILSELAGEGEPSMLTSQIILECGILMGKSVNEHSRYASQMLPAFGGVEMN